MTTPAFSSLLYTDCRSGQGMRGGAGFQFQAVSAGVEREVMTLVQRSALYEAPIAWMRAQRQVSDYPPSLAHVFDGVYVTARGRYLGVEAGGVREGNQFTHAVSTGDPESYGVVRPAQLWGAAWWREQPAATTTCDPVDAEPEPGPWSVDAVREWVLAQPDAASWLTALVSALDRMHGQGHRRVVFVAADPEPVLCWLAAGTLLLPQRRALRIGFRVFASNPQYSQHEVLGLHPEWAGQFADPDRDHGFVVFNLDTGRHTPVEPTDPALHWVPRFLHADPYDADPYDVVDAIELAHKFAEPRDPCHGGDLGSPAAGPLADRLASGAVVLGETASDAAQAATLTEWLVERVGTLNEDVTEAVVSAILAAPIGVGTLRQLDTAVHGRRQREPAARVRRALLDAEIAMVLRHAGTPPPQPLPAAEWDDRKRASAAESAEAALRGTPPQRMDAMLRTLARFGLNARVYEFRDAAHQFITWWADTAQHQTPAMALRPDQWNGGDALLDLLRDELARRLAATPPDQHTVDAVRGRWWRLLWPTISDPTSPLDARLAAAAVEHGGPEVRSQVITTVIAGLSQSGRADNTDRAWTALFDHVPPTVDDLVRFLRALPPTQGTDMPQAIAREALHVIRSASRNGPTAAALDALRMLAERGVTTGELATWYEQDKALRLWLALLPTAVTVSGLPSIADVGGEVFDARATALLDSLLSAPLASAVAAVTEGGPILHEVLLRRLPATWTKHDAGDRRSTAVALAHEAAHRLNDKRSDHLAKDLARRWGNNLSAWVRASDPNQRGRVTSVLKAYDEPAAERWRKWARTWAAEAPATTKPASTAPAPASPAAKPPKSGSDPEAPSPPEGGTGGTQFSGLAWPLRPWRRKR